MNILIKRLKLQYLFLVVSKTVIGIIGQTGRPIEEEMHHTVIDRIITPIMDDEIMIMN